jgi:hypothetical protein
LIRDTEFSREPFSSATKYFRFLAEGRAELSAGILEVDLDFLPTDSVPTAGSNPATARKPPRDPAFYAAIPRMLGAESAERIATFQHDLNARE